MSQRRTVGANLEDVADWSPWLSLDEAVKVAPRLPGVYLARQGEMGPIVYAGMAGERSGQGIRGRLRAYASGKGLVSGLGEAVLDRALADRLGTPQAQGCRGR